MRGFTAGDGVERRGRKDGKLTMIDLYYIEDDPGIALIVKEYLEQKNFKVTICETLARPNPCFAGLEYAGWTRG